MEITGAIAEYVARTAYADLPDEAVTRAKRAVLDTLAVMLAGSREDCAVIAAELVAEEGGRPAATVVGQGFGAPVRAAALVNGTAAHALDYDDVTPNMHGHPSPPLLPAALAVSEERGASGRDLILAYLLGFEVQGKLGRGMGDSHYTHGWHATSTLGTLGAAVATAKLEGLDAQRTRMALGIATSLASGSRQNFGTMTKPLHPGIAAQGGITAAKLAARGFTADEQALEAPLGFLNLFSAAGDARPERVLPELGDPLEIVSVGLSVKKYPCCFNTHGALDAMLALRQEHGFGAEEVDWVTATVSQTGREAMPAPRAGGEAYRSSDGREAAAVAIGALIHPRPWTGLEGKFSMQYCMAAALLDGRAVLDTFTDAAVQRPEAQRLLRRVELTQEATAQIGPTGMGHVVVTLKNGTRLERRCDQPRGGPANPLSWKELEAKFRDCATRVIGEAATEEAIGLISALERVEDVTRLTRVLAGQEARARV